jgi:hypothetical protein
LKEETRAIISATEQWIPAFAGMTIPVEVPQTYPSVAIIAAGWEDR